MNFKQKRRIWFFVPLASFLFAINCYAQQTGPESLQWFWVSANYGTPVITTSDFNKNGILEIKVGSRLTANNITLVGGLNNSLRGNDSILPERFSLFFGPGYFFKDKRIFFSVNAGLSYPFYKNAPEDYPQSLGMHNALDLGLRLATKFTIGVGMNQHISNDVPAYTFRFFIQMNSQ